jgi:hypothetical protein
MNRNLVFRPVSSNCATWANHPLFLQQLVSCDSHHFVNEMWHSYKTATPHILADSRPVLLIASLSDNPVGGHFQYNVVIFQFYPGAFRPTRAYRYVLEVVRVVTIKMIVFCHMTPCILVCSYGRRGRSFSFPQEFCHVSTKLHGITFRKTMFVLFTANDYHISHNQTVKFPFLVNKKWVNVGKTLFSVQSVCCTLPLQILFLRNHPCSPNFCVTAGQTRNCG